MSLTTGLECCFMSSEVSVEAEAGEGGFLFQAHRLEKERASRERWAGPCGTEPPVVQ